MVRMSDSKNLWTGKADAPAGPLQSSWANAQNVNIPSGGKYLVLSNYRFWLGSKSNGFVKARVTLNGNEIGKVKMITERMHPTRKSFINYGGWSFRDCAVLKTFSITSGPSTTTDRDIHTYIHRYDGMGCQRGWRWHSQCAILFHHRRWLPNGE